MDLSYIYILGMDQVTSQVTRWARANSVKGSEMMSHRKRMSHRVKGIGVGHKGEAMHGDKLTGLCALIHIGRNNSTLTKLSGCVGEYVNK